MGSTLLSLYHAVYCTLDGHCQVFDTLFHRYIVLDETGHFCGVLGSAVKNGWMPTTAMAMVYG
jgi:hypothetical protein